MSTDVTLQYNVSPPSATASKRLTDAPELLRVFIKPGSRIEPVTEEAILRRRSRVELDGALSNPDRARVGVR